MNRSQKWMGNIAGEQLLVIALALVSAVAFVIFSSHPGLAGDALGYFRASTGEYGGFWGGNPLVVVHLVRAPWYVLTLTLLSALLSPLGKSVFMAGVYLFQALLYALNTGLIFAITEKISGSRKVALATGVVALLYLPLLFYADHLLREMQLCIFMLAFVWCWINQRDKAGAIFLFLAITSNFFIAWLQYLVLAAGLLLAWVFDWLQYGKTFDWNWRRLLRYALLLLLPYLALCFLFSFLNYSRLDGGSLAMYADTFGWSTIVPANSELRYRLIGENIHLPAIFNLLPETLSTTIKWFTQEPAGFVKRYIINVYRFFAHPSNVYFRTWLFITPDALRFLHQIILMLWLMVLPLSLRSKTHRVMLFLVLVWAVSFALHHIEDRYNVPVMGMIIITALTQWYGLFKTMNRKTIVTALLSGLLLTFWLRGDLYPFALMIIPNLAPVTWVALGIMLAAVALAWWYSRLLDKGFAALVMTACVILPVLLTFLYDPFVAGWKTSLEPDKIVERTIPLPPTFFKPDNLITYLLIDTEPAFNTPRLTLTLNDLPVSLENQVVPVGLTLQKYLHGDGLVPIGNFRQYRFIPLNAAHMAAMEKTRIATIRIGNNDKDKKVDLYGDYPATMQGDYWIPTPHWAFFSTYKVFYDHDGRLPESVTGEHSRSMCIEGCNGNTADLSPLPGLQKGQYRVLLLRLLPDDGDKAGYPLAEYKIDGEGRIYKVFGLAY